MVGCFVLSVSIVSTCVRKSLPIGMRRAEVNMCPTSAQVGFPKRSQEVQKSMPKLDEKLDAISEAIFRANGKQMGGKWEANICA